MSPAVSELADPTEAPLPDDRPADEDGADALRVHLPSFDGPLDLLLHLIRKNQVNIYDIPIAQITEEYHRTLDLMRELDLEIAGEFVYMAALLIHIKSKMLLPRNEEAASGEDPRQELVDRLLEYRRMKLAAESLHELEAVERAVWTRPPTPPPRVDEVDLPLAECSLFDLVDVFQKVLERFRLAHPADYEVAVQRFSVKEKILQILGRLEEQGNVPLLSLLSDEPSRAEIVVLFVATLELVRMQIARAVQPEAFGEIRLERTELAIDVAHFEDTYR